MSKAIAKRALEGAGVLLGVFAMLLLLAVGVGPKLLPYRVVTVYTDSMRPSMPAGSLVLQTPIAVQDVRRGDVITYRIPIDDHRVVTHRVVEIVASGEAVVVRTKGDSNRAADPWLARLESERTWKVRAAVPRAGVVIQAFRTPAAQRLAIFGVPAVLAVLWLRDIWAPRGRRGSAAAASPTGG